MPFAELDPTLAMYYEDDCFVEPWLTPSTVMLVHGNGESSASWYGWMPELTRRFRVLRPDLRGLGKSTPQADDYVFSTEAWAADLVCLLDKLSIESVHLVGAKFGGTVAAWLAAEYPQRVRTLSMMSALIKSAGTGSRLEVSTMPGKVSSLGHRAFVEDTQRLRLGSEASDEQVRWWNQLMTSNDRVSSRVVAYEASTDMVEVLPRIKAPTLVVTTDRSAIARLESVVEWQQRLVNSELLVLPSDGYHVAVLNPDECVQNVVRFIGRHSRGG